uniref:Uncharacterized protein n=1 Tax=Steinernema glaseri TaxID=37863 RepID=A0A1I8A8H0_9BILA
MSSFQFALNPQVLNNDPDNDWVNSRDNTQLYLIAKFPLPRYLHADLFFMHILLFCYLATLPLSWVHQDPFFFVTKSSSTWGFEDFYSRAELSTGGEYISRARKCVIR